MRLDALRPSATGPRRLIHPSPAGKAPVSVIVPVKNEAGNLGRCLPALAWADEIFVVDSQSTDGTGEVATQFGAAVIQFHYNGTYPKKKNWCSTRFHSGTSGC